MSTVANPIFIKSESKLSISDVLLNLYGDAKFDIGESLDYSSTNKQCDRLFIGEHDDCLILSNLDLAMDIIYKSESNFMKFQNSLVAGIIVNTQTGWEGFGLIENGIVQRQVAFSEDGFGRNIGKAIKEEEAVEKFVKLNQKEKKELVEEGLDPEDVIKMGIVSKAIDILTKRFVDYELMEIQNNLFLQEYIIIK